MAEYANLSPEEIKKIEALEAELKAQGTNAVLLAYAKYAELSEEALGLIQDLEAKLEEMGTKVILIAYDNN